MKTAFFSFGFLLVLAYPLLIIGAGFLVMIALDSARHIRRPTGGKSLWPWRYSFGKPLSRHR